MFYVPFDKIVTSARTWQLAKSNVSLQKQHSPKVFKTIKGKQGITRERDHVFPSIKKNILFVHFGHFIGDFCLMSTPTWKALV